MVSVPPALLGFIGGSGTLGMNFPQDLQDESLEFLEEGLVYKTPFGESPPFTLFQVRGKEDYQVLSCHMHGWRSGVTRAQASRQVFWVLREAGVKKVISEGGVGSLNHLLDPRDIVIPHDYIDFSLRKDVDLGTNQLLIMRQPLCPQLRDLLYRTAEAYPLKRVFSRGVYVVTDGRHFESPSECQMLKQWGGDIVGQSLCPEVYLAREIGACFAGLYTVVNYGEGIVKAWEHRELAEIFHQDAPRIGKILGQAMKELTFGECGCECQDLRKPTLLNKVYK
ncbi:MAG: MTAP family purine nucleoside phosphorylase [Bacillota bacterium]|uniref:Phosphorylase n=1 Tax=Thermanaerosceptrum fracticalcis TaxID=1712410 RepID=A0A7G6E5H3_THEFR|nr:MTAP family purine nucleoside phosphorylase [Thermanaerosceptrum fracticalcis]QNB47327.1 phosphorylase [Thermanaerosceptrum fracticalcis]